MLRDKCLWRLTSSLLMLPGFYIDLPFTRDRMGQVQHNHWLELKMVLHLVFVLSFFFFFLSTASKEEENKTRN